MIFTLVNERNNDNNYGYEVEIQYVGSEYIDYVWFDQNDIDRIEDADYLVMKDNHSGIEYMVRIISWSLHPIINNRYFEDIIVGMIHLNK